MNEFKSKKISFLIPNIIQGGSERIFEQVSSFLAKSTDYKIEFFLNGSSKVRNLPLNKRIKIYSKYNISYKQYIFYLIKYFNSNKPDLIFTSLYIIGFCAIIAKFFSKHKPKVVFGAHNALSFKIRFADNNSDRYFLKYLTKILINKADRVISASKGVGNELIENFGLKRYKLINIYGPTLAKDKIDNYLKFKNHHKFFKLKKHKIITCVGRLSPQKGYDIILKAFYFFEKKYKSKLIIIGEGSEKEKLKKICLKLKIRQHVSFVGSQKNPYNFISNSDLFVTASKWEGLSIAIIDALYSGTNVVAANCNYGPSEILDNGKFGILTKVGSEKELLKGMIKSIQKKNKLRDKIKNKSRAKSFLNKTAENKYKYLIEELLV